MQIENHLIPLNQFLEDADGNLQFEPGARFLDGIDGRVISEAKLEAWAVCRVMQMPSKGCFCFCGGDYDAKLRTWKEMCANDMELLLTQPAAYWEEKTPFWTKFLSIGSPGYYYPAEAVVQV